MKRLIHVTAAIVVVMLYMGCTASSSSLRYADTKQPTHGRSFVSLQPESEGVAEPADTSSVSMIPSDDDDGVLPEPKKIDFTKAFRASEKSAANVTANFADAIESLKMAIILYDAAPYHYGGNDIDGIDCSGFTLNVFQQAFQVHLPRSAREQFCVGDRIRDKDNLKFGDLVFFNTRRRVRPGHVGIYIGDGKFVHSSSSYGVMVSSLDEEYYDKRFMGGSRVMDIETAQAMNN